MTTNYSILHISDLHRIKEENIECLLSSFEVEKAHFEEMGLPPVQLIVVSGDVVNGSNLPDAYAAKQEIQTQYAVASKFLEALCALFLGLESSDRLRVIIVPGNHDMSRYLSKLSMTEIDHDDINPLVDALWGNDTDIRWSWQNLHFHKITDKKTYSKRFEDFSDFYNHFYQGQRTYPSDPERQSDLIDMTELNISLACFNSCFQLDHLRQSGYISPRSLSMLTRPLLSAKKQGRLVIGVWHHHTHGLPNENNYLDYSILENMVQNGIVLALHGHQHISGIVNEYRDVFSESKLPLISAGTLYGNSSDLPVGKMRQYNLLVVNMDDDHCDVTLHSREDKTALNEMPAWEAGVIGRSHKTSYTLTVPVFPAEQISEEVELQEKINQINLLSERTGNLEDGAKQLEQLGTEIPLVRKFLLDYHQRIGNNKRICEIFCEPQNINEAMAVIESCIKCNDGDTMNKVINSDFIKSSTDASLKEIIMDARFRLKVR